MSNFADDLVRFCVGADATPVKEVDDGGVDVYVSYSFYCRLVI